MKCAVCGRDHNKIIDQNIKTSHVKRDVEVDLFFKSSGDLLVCSRCVATHIIPLKNGGKKVVGYLTKSDKLVIYPQAKTCRDVSFDIDESYRTYKDIFVTNSEKIEGDASWI